MLNNNEELSEEDRKLFETIKDMDAIIVVNKTDLEQKVNAEELKQLAGSRRIINVSVKEEQGVDELENTIADMYLSGEVQTDDLTYVSNARHIGLLNQALESTNDVLIGLENGLPIDILQIDMTKTWEVLGEITGESVHDELINQLFSQFCLGK